MDSTTFETDNIESHTPELSGKSVKGGRGEGGGDAFRPPSVLRSHSNEILVALEQSYCGVWQRVLNVPDYTFSYGGHVAYLFYYLVVIISIRVFLVLFQTTDSA